MNKSKTVLLEFVENWRLCADAISPIATGALDEDELIRRGRAKVYRHCADQLETALAQQAQPEKVCSFGITEPHTCYELTPVDDVHFINTVEFRNRGDVSFALARFAESKGDFDSNGKALIDTVLRAALSVSDARRCSCGLLSDHAGRCLNEVALATDHCRASGNKPHACCIFPAPQAPEDALADEWRALVNASRNLTAPVAMTDFADPENARHNMTILEESAKVAERAAYAAFAALRAVSQPTDAEIEAEATLYARPAFDEAEQWKAAADFRAGAKWARDTTQATRIY